MDAFEQYMNHVFNRKDKYDGEKTRVLLKAFADPLVQHLHEDSDDRAWSERMGKETFLRHGDGLGWRTSKRPQRHRRGRQGKEQLEAK